MSPRGPCTRSPNAALAVAAVRLLLGGLEEAAVRPALAGTAVPGRLQVVAERPLVLADGAHNPDGVRVLAQSLAAVARPAPDGRRARDHARTRTTRRCSRGLLPLLDRRRLHAGRGGAEPQGAELAAALRAVAARAARPGPAEARRARPARRAGAWRAALGRPAGTVLVTGSLYLLEDLRDVLAGGY